MVLQTFSEVESASYSVYRCPPFPHAHRVFRTVADVVVVLEVAKVVAIEWGGRARGVVAIERGAQASSRLLQSNGGQTKQHDEGPECQ